MSEAGGKVRPASEFAARRPAVGVAVAMMLGIFIHRFLPHQPLQCTVLLGVLIALAIYFIRWTKLCTILILAAMGCAGLALAQLTAFFYPRDHISEFASDDRCMVQLELSIDNPPRELTWPFEHTRASPPKQVITSSVRGIKTWTGWSSCNGDVLVQIGQPHPRLRQGQIVRVVGMLERPAPAMNPGQFDWADCALADSVRAVRVAFWELAGGSSAHPREATRKTRRTRAGASLVRSR